MKRLIYISIFLISSFAFAQGYQAKLVRTGSGNTTYTFTTRATYTAFSGNTQVDVFTDVNIASSNEPPSLVYLNSATLPITRITLEYSRTYQEGGGAVSNCTVNQTVNITDTNCFTTFINRCVDFNVEVYNTQLPIVQPANNTICIEEPLMLQATNDCVNGSYNWEYATAVTGPFQSLGVQSTGVNPVSVNLNAFLPNGFSGNVFIRAILNGRFTNTIIYTIISCTPGISSVAISPTTCSNSSDGGFTITFDESLNNQQILFELRRDSATGPIESSFTATINGTSYIWPDPLVARTYFLEYQSTPAGSVVQYSPIIITSPSPLLFTAGWTDVDCFGENTGSISIMASGGQGNYQYSINNGSTWFAFSNATTHNITNLPTGNYQVMVRDSNNCIAQQ